MPKDKSQKFRLLVLCGGPSMERGISLNSCRSICDHLDTQGYARIDTPKNATGIEIQPVYMDTRRRFYKISRDQLYSNTPSDFDFKLEKTAKRLTKRELVKICKEADLVFPAIHGAFGEDGVLQSFLEKNKCRFIGSPSNACKIAFNKFASNELIKKHGFASLPSVLLKSHAPKSENKRLLKEFFRAHGLKRAIVKPVSGGSSIGVHSVTTHEEAMRAMQDIFSKKIDTQAVCEPFCEGREFTVVILQNRFGLPVALIPSEIETTYAENQIFDYRKKYLPTRKVHYHCPPRFTETQIRQIQNDAENLFTLLGMRHFARFDGWLLKDGRIWFSDFNPISGMEQNSFLFQQSSQIGMTHRDVLLHIIRRACETYGINPPCAAQQSKAQKEIIRVLGGGTSAERQVSVMSATNVWLKLRTSEKYWPELYIQTGADEIWRIPYNMSLNHTVEEIADTVRNAKNNSAWLTRHRDHVLMRLALASPNEEASENLFLPQKMTIKAFLRLPGFVFLGLHGGSGEDGTIQRLLQKHHKHFNGSGPAASRICMNKEETGRIVSRLANHGITTAPKKVFPISNFANFTDDDYKNFWRDIRTAIAPTIIVKPVDDGCSAGIARLSTWEDLKKYIHAATHNIQELPIGTLKDQHGVIEMPTQIMRHIMLESFIETDRPRIAKNKLIWQRKTDWIEVTCGILGTRNNLHALNPSLTVALGHVLSLEEKFQGGTGINITPPPTPHVTPTALSSAKRRIEIAATALGIEGYARLDAFMHTRTGELIIIEANTLPALTPSTVLFHQGLAENPRLPPRALLEHLIKLGSK